MRTEEKQAVPLRIRISVQNGRQYLLAYIPGLNRMASFRTDSIVSVKPGEPCEQFDRLRRELDRMMPHLWGTSMPAAADRPLEHIMFTVEYTDQETHIHRRLEREKRCGTVEKCGENSSRFSADVYDALELLPWIRTFICRITRFECSNPDVEARFWNDLDRMYQMYEPEGGEDE